MEYPKDVEQTFRKHFKENVWMINGYEIAKNLGKIQVANVVLIGALSNFSADLKEEQWIEAIKSLLADRLHEINIKAYYAGRSAISSPNL
jgi:indolepyruvate ferredoxin oxidoreductase beta subunit